VRAALVKTALAAGAVGVLMAAATSCAAARTAADHSAEAGGAAGGGALVYIIALSSGAAGWVAAGLAGVGGWIGAWFFTPRAAMNAAPAGFPWGILVLGGLAFALVRAWAHYPAIMGRAWALVKVTARGFLGGRTPPPVPPPTGAA
jgi:hypothetical protein